MLPTTIKSYCGFALDTNYMVEPFRICSSIANNTASCASKSVLESVGCFWQSGSCSPTKAGFEGYCSSKVTSTTCFATPVQLYTDACVWYRVEVALNAFCGFPFDKNPWTYPPSLCSIKAKTAGECEGTGFLSSSFCIWKGDSCESAPSNIQFANECSSFSNAGKCYGYRGGDGNGLCKWYEPTRPPTMSPTLHPTVNPTLSSIPSRSPSVVPSKSLNPTLSFIPSRSPSLMPSISSLPSNDPSPAPTSAPSARPTPRPANRLDVAPIQLLTPNPTHQPTSNPTRPPSPFPTNLPSAIPTIVLTERPTQRPTRAPTVLITISPIAPSRSPSAVPSTDPTFTPTSLPSRKPSALPSNQPSFSPARSPSATPSEFPSAVPSRSPTETPTQTPSFSDAPKPEATKDSPGMGAWTIAAFGVAGAAVGGAGCCGACFWLSKKKDESADRNDTGDGSHTTFGAFKANVRPDPRSEISIPIGNNDKTVECDISSHDDIRINRFVSTVASTKRQRGTVLVTPSPPGWVWEKCLRNVLGKQEPAFPKTSTLETADENKSIVIIGSPPGWIWEKLIRFIRKSELTVHPDGK